MSGGRSHRMSNASRGQGIVYLFLVSPVVSGSEQNLLEVSLKGRLCTKHDFRVAIFDVFSNSLLHIYHLPRTPYLLTCYNQANVLNRLKCNREKPCQNCIVRGDSVAAACSYASAANLKSSGSKGVKPAPIDMRSRIDRLETLVRSLISQEGQSNGLDGSASNRFAENDPALAGRISRRNQFSSQSIGSEDTERSEDTFISAGGQKMSIDTRSTHWDAILHDVGTKTISVPRTPSF